MTRVYMFEFSLPVNLYFDHDIRLKFPRFIYWSVPIQYEGP